MAHRYAVKRSKKVFRKEEDGGGLSPAFCERMRHQIDIYHQIGRGLSIAHLYGAGALQDWLPQAEPPVDWRWLMQ